MSSAEHEIRAVADLSARRTREQAWRQFGQATSAEEFCASWLVIQSHEIGGVSDGVVVLQKPGTPGMVPVAFLPENSTNRTKLAEVTERALKEQQGVVLRLEATNDAGNRCQLAHPVQLDGELRGVIGLELEARPDPQIRAAMRELQWGSGWLEVLLRRHADPQEAARLRLKLALDLVSALLENEGLADGGAALVTELATRLGCDRATLGVLDRAGRIKIRAVSHSGQFDKRANLLQAAGHAMEEAIDQRAVVAHPPLAEGAALVSRAHEALVREAGSGACATFPLEASGRIVGALTLERPAGFQLDAPSVELAGAVAAVCGPVVALKLAAERSLFARVAELSQKYWGQLVGPRHALIKLIAAVTFLTALFLAFATGTYRVSADAAVEGEVLRALSAPIAGFVKEAPRRAGDTVKAGELIGRFDDRDLRLERVRLASQQGQHTKQYREAMAKHDRPQAAIALAQLDQVGAQIALVDEQLARIEMTAPFDGVVVSGDLSQKLGAPVERGQVLFEVAPLNSFRIALQVDEHEFADVSPGLHGSLAVNSIPHERFPFTVTKVTAVNAVKDGKNRFRVEARLDAPPGRLRPGMEGVGKIEVDERKLVWIWTHTLVDRIRLWIWSALP